MNKPIIIDMQEKYNNIQGKGTKEAVITAYETYNEYMKSIDEKNKESIIKTDKNETIQIPTTEEIRNGVERLVIDDNIEER